MAAKTETRMIPDSEGAKHQYQVTQLSARSALFFKFRLGKALAPGLGQLKSALGALAKTQDDESDLSPTEQKTAIGAALGAVEAILMTLDPSEAQSIIEYTLTQCHVVRDGQKIPNAATIDLLYTGNLKEMFKAAMFVWEVNFADFFAGLGKLLDTSKASPNQETE